MNMENIIEQLRTELAEIFNRGISDSFIGFLRSDKLLLENLQQDFQRGKNLCIEIIKHARRIP
jgi:hypothetical protein